VPDNPKQGVSRVRQEGQEGVEGAERTQIKGEKSNWKEGPETGIWAKKSGETDHMVLITDTQEKRVDSKKSLRKKEKTNAMVLERGGNYGTEPALDFSKKTGSKNCTKRGVIKTGRLRLGKKRCEPVTRGHA